MRYAGIDVPDPTRDSDGNLVLDSGVQIGSAPVGQEGPSPDEAEEPEDQPDIDPEEMQAAQETCGAPPIAGAAIDQDL
jgi:hypothetical protein